MGHYLSRIENKRDKPNEDWVPILRFTVHGIVGEIKRIIGLNRLHIVLFAHNVGLL
jgi:hypothetical protein